MSSPANTYQLDHEDREKRLRYFLEAAVEEYKLAKDAHRRLEAMVKYAQARKDLSAYLGVDVN